MAMELAVMSDELAALVERAAQSVVAVHARPRLSSSGVFWRPGVIVTAEHTVRREEEITVTLPDGTVAPATLAGSDAGTDVAVLRIEAAGNAAIPPASVVPAPGNLVLTIGRSQDSGANATLGIVSATSGPWRTWRGGKLDHYIRLDLTVYPGSSGGAVVNSEGEAVGVATLVLSRAAGVAIPVTTVNRVVDEILKRGQVTRGYLGVGLHPVELQNHLKGQVVLSVEPGGPAAKAGMLVGDVLVSLGGQAVPDTEDVLAALESAAIGQSIDGEVMRGGVLTSLALAVKERPGRR